MPRDTSVWLPLQSRRALVHGHPIMALSVMVLHVDAMSPVSHCNNKQTREFEYSYAAVPLRLSGSCVERRSRLCVKQKNYRKVLRGKRCVPDPES